MYAKRGPTRKRGFYIPMVNHPIAKDQAPAPSRGVPDPRWRLLWPVAYVILRVAAPFVRMPHPAVGSVLATVLFLLVPLMWLRRVSEWRLRFRIGFPAFVALALVWSEIRLGLPTGVLGLIPWNHHLNALHAMALVAHPIADIALISAAALLGTLLSRIISDPKMLLPVAFVGAVVDYWGVYLGTTAAFIHAAPELVQKASAEIPAFGSAYQPQGLHIASFVGFGDWLFLTMFLAVAWRYDLQPRRTFWALLGFLVPAMLIVVFGGLNYLPAIVPMALAVFAVNGRRLKLSREETFASLYALLLVAALIGAYTLVAAHFLHAHVPIAK